MKYKEIVREFMIIYSDQIMEIEMNQSGRKDIPLRCETWNNYTDSLCKEGRITERQYDNMDYPKFCK